MRRSSACSVKEGSWRNTLFGLVFLGALARLILFTGFSQATLNLFNVVFIYAIAATGIAFLYSYGGLLSLAHGGLWGIGAYFAAVLAQNHHWSVWPVILVGDAELRDPRRPVGVVVGAGRGATSSSSCSPSPRSSSA